MVIYYTDNTYNFINDNFVKENAALVYMSNSPHVPCFSPWLAACPGSLPLGQAHRGGNHRDEQGQQAPNDPVHGF